jgi:ABC-type transport system substrate-binding protein
MKKAIFFCVSMILIASLTGCRAKNSNVVVEQAAAIGLKTGQIDPNRKTTENTNQRYPKIVVGLSTDFDDFLPKHPNRGSKPYIYWSIYECLFDLVDGKYVPSIAKGYTEIDPLHWNVEIWDFVKDSQGNQITADDVIYSINWLLDSKEYIQMEALKGVKKIDDYTIQFEWNFEPINIGDLEGPWCRIFIFSKNAFESNNFATNPIATGPYTIKELVVGAKVVLEANDNYWALDTEAFKNLTKAHHANVQTIEYHIILESAQHTIAMETKSIDFSEFVQPDSLYQFQEGGKYADIYNCYTQLSSMYIRLDPNCSPEAITGDVNLRKAIYWAIDNQVASISVKNTVPLKALGSNFFTDYVEAWETMDTYESGVSIERAKEFLAKSSYKGEKLRLVCSTSEEERNLATVVQAMLLQAGINTEIMAIDNSMRSLVTDDPKGYELKIQEAGGGSLIGSWGGLYKIRPQLGKTALFVDVDNNYEKVAYTAANMKTHNDQTMTALYQHILDNAYDYAMVGRLKSTVYSKDVAELYFREGQYATMSGSMFYLD